MAKRDTGLERCPFCGASAFDEKVALLKTPGGFYYVACIACGGQTTTVADEELAKKRWNKRYVA